jgi:HD-like signal output (HDOD) protein
VGVAMFKEVNFRFGRERSAVETNRFLKNLTSGDASIADLSEFKLNRKETACFLARELQHLGNIALHADYKSLATLLEELHVALLHKALK